MTGSGRRGRQVHAGEVDPDRCQGGVVELPRGGSPTLDFDVEPARDRGVVQQAEQEVVRPDPAVPQTGCFVRGPGDRLLQSG